MCRVRRGSLRCGEASNDNSQKINEIIADNSTLSLKIVRNL